MTEFSLIYNEAHPLGPATIGLKWRGRDGYQYGMFSALTAKFSILEVAEVLRQMTFDIDNNFDNNGNRITKI